MSVKRLDHGDLTFFVLKVQLAFLSRSHVLKETSNHCRTDSGSGERWKACDSRIISAHDRIFSWFNRYTTIIYWIDMTIAWERYCWCRTPKSWCFKSMFVSVFRCQITKSYPIDTVESWPTCHDPNRSKWGSWSRGRRPNWTLEVVGKMEGQHGPWSLRWHGDFRDESERFEHRKLLMLIFCSEVSF